MRKAFACFAFLVILLCGSVFFIGMDIYGERDQVVFAENIIVGESADAENLTIRLRSKYDHNMFWETTYHAGTEPQIGTDYLFSAKNIYEDYEYNYEGVSTYTEFGLDSYADQESPWQGLIQVYQELILEAEPYVEHSKTYYLKDCIEYYPIAVMLDFPGLYLAWSGTFYTDMAQTDVPPGTETYVIQRFQDFFRIPVLEGEQIELSVEVDKEGNVYSGGMGTGIGEAFYMTSYSAILDRAAYFTFDTEYRENGYPVDTSLIPGGYGIYCLPYEEDYRNEDGQLICGAKIDEMSMVYPLNPEIEILHLGKNQDETELLLHTVEEGNYMLTVIDIATMSEKQKMKLMEMPEEYWDFCIHEDEDYFAAVLCGYKITVVQKRNGEYEQRILTDMILPEENSYISERADMDYDGNRLVLTDYVGGRYDCTDFYVMIYDENGLVYHARYDTSLNAGDSDNRYAYHVNQADRDPLSVEWEK